MKRSEVILAMVKKAKEVHLGDSIHHPDFEYRLVEDLLGDDNEKK